MKFRVTTKPEISRFVRSGILFSREPKVIEVGKDVDEKQMEVIKGEAMLVVIDITDPKAQEAYEIIDKQVEEKKDVAAYQKKQKRAARKKPLVEITDNK